MDSAIQTYSKTQSSISNNYPYYAGTGGKKKKRKRPLSYLKLRFLANLNLLLIIIYSIIGLRLTRFATILQKILAKKHFVSISLSDSTNKIIYYC